MKESQWIPASEKLPPELDDVLVCTQSKNGARNIDKGYLMDGRFVHRGTAAVTHWMPIPDFPET